MGERGKSGDELTVAKVNSFDSFTTIMFLSKHRRRSSVDEFTIRRQALGETLVDSLIVAVSTFRRHFASVFVVAEFYVRR